MEAEIRKLSKRRDGNDSDDEPSKKKAKKSYLEEELAKYAKGRGAKKGKNRKDESDVLEALNNFRGKLKTQMVVDDDGDEGGRQTVRSGDDEGKMDFGGTEEADEERKQDVFGNDPGMEVDDDRGFMSHALNFPKDDGEESRKAERDYEVIDPRARGARAKEEERERKRAAKAKSGGGGRYRR